MCPRYMLLHGWGARSGRKKGRTIHMSTDMIRSHHESTPSDPSLFHCSLFWSLCCCSISFSHSAHPDLPIADVFRFISLSCRYGILAQSMTVSEHCKISTCLALIPELNSASRLITFCEANVPLPTTTPRSKTTIAVRIDCLEPTLSQDVLDSQSHTNI